MAYVVGAIVLVGAVSLLNLVLIYGVIRRLREHTEALQNRSAEPRDDRIHPVGTRVAEFNVRTKDGMPLSRTDLGPSTLFAFFAPGCQPCAELLPRFAEAAAGGSLGATVAVVSPGEEAGDYVERLGAASTVVMGEDAETLVAAFGVGAWPAMATLDDQGTITGIGTELPARREPISI